MRRTRVLSTALGFALLGLLLAGGASWATESICFDWSVSATSGTIDVDASASTGSITSYVWAWGDGSYQLPSSSPTKSHAYTSPPPYDSTITLFINFTSGDVGTASCDTWPWSPTFGPQPPSSGTCCGTVCPASGCPITG
jgi:hypothetical protein